MKPRVAFFDFASCEGCQLQVINLEEDLLALAHAVDIVSFREAMSEHSEPYDVAFVEGSITRKSDEDRLRKIRENAGTVVALGACAAIGGVNALKNLGDLDAVRREVYGSSAHLFETYATRPAGAVIKVDYCIPGCPIDAEEFLSVVKALLMGLKPEIPSYPVCVECKLDENPCLFDHDGFCLGPVTRAGCGAVCPKNRRGCLGCRGPVDDPAVQAEMEVLTQHGLSLEDALGKFQIFGGCLEVLQCQPER
jgi:coenzyme F420-reducing hydrogenase gamma subunit